MKTAIILGATGLTGGILLQHLLKDDRYERIKVFTRKTVGFDHPKLEEHIVDLFELEKVQQDFVADEIYCCVGSTKAKTPDLEVYRRVDYGIPLSAARLAKRNGINCLLIVSALGADPDSRFFYNRIKGEMERDVLQENLPQTYFFQPSLITGDRKEKRTFESLWKQVMKAGNYMLLGPFKKYRSISAQVIARAMIRVANSEYSEIRIESDEIKNIAAQSDLQKN